MKQPKYIQAMDRKWKRPTRHIHRSWKQPARERKHPEDSRVRYRLDAYPGYMELAMSWDHDEGYSFCIKTVDFDIGYMAIVEGGSDCDGKVSHETVYHWDATLGDWVPEDSEVYDQFARAAGY